MHKRVGTAKGRSSPHKSRLGGTGQDRATPKVSALQDLAGIFTHQQGSKAGGVPEDLVVRQNLQGAQQVTSNAAQVQLFEPLFLTRLQQGRSTCGESMFRTRSTGKQIKSGIKAVGY